MHQPQEAMKKISQVNGWWAKNFTGKAEKLNDKFSVHFDETFVDFKISELVPNKKVVWKVTDCNLHWIKAKKEWKGTEVVFEISERKMPARMTSDGQHRSTSLMLVWCRGLNVIMIVKRDGMAMLQVAW